MPVGCRCCKGGDGPALLADRRRLRVVAAAELFACLLLRPDALRAVRAEALGLSDEVGQREMTADPGRVVVWAVAEPDAGRAARTSLGAAILFVGADGGRFRRVLLLAYRAVAAADRMLRERRGRGPGQGG
jgi:hypothetical protein